MKRRKFLRGAAAAAVLPDLRLQTDFSRYIRIGSRISYDEKEGSNDENLPYCIPGQLILKIDEIGQKQLQAWRRRDEENEENDFDDLSERWGTTDAEHALLEHLIGNSELEWGDPNTNKDLTDAPMLCIWGEDIPDEKRGEVKDHFGFIETSSDTCIPVIARWGYPHYCLRSFMDDLADSGKAIFIDRW